MKVENSELRKRPPDGETFCQIGRCLDPPCHADLKNLRLSDEKRVLSTLRRKKRSFRGLKLYLFRKKTETHIVSTCLYQMATWYVEMFTTSLISVLFCVYNPTFFTGWFACLGLLKALRALSSRSRSRTPPPKKYLCGRIKWERSLRATW